MRPAKFVFEPFREVEKKVKSHRKRGFNINTRYGSLTFPKSYVEDNTLDGKYIKWFLDVDRKAFGWKILGESKEEMLPDLKGYIQVKKQPSTGVYQFQVKRVLNTFQFKEEVCFKDLEVQRYVNNHDSFYNGTIHYLILDNPEPCGERRKNKDTHATTT